MKTIQIKQYQLNQPIKKSKDKSITFDKERIDMILAIIGIIAGLIGIYILLTHQSYFY